MKEPSGMAVSSLMKPTNKLPPHSGGTAVHSIDPLDERHVEIRVESMKPIDNGRHMFHRKFEAGSGKMAYPVAPTERTASELKKCARWAGWSS